MALSTRTDPLRGFKFRVSIQHPEIDSISKLGFASMSGLSVQNEMIPYREGGWNTNPHKMVGQSDFAALSFSKGVMPFEGQLWEWQKYIHYYQFGGGRLTDPTSYRCDVQAEVFDHPVTKNVSEANPGPVRLKFMVYNCWPGAFAFSDLDAMGNSLLIQQMTVHHEGFTPTWQ